MTGFVPRFLSADAMGADSTIDTEPLWWPPAKIVGRHLSPFLAEQLGLVVDVPPPAGHAVPVEVAIDTSDHAKWARV